MRILVTNDDGIDSVGLHVLAREMTKHGDVVLVAPDEEYSGASSSIGALNVIHPTVSRTTVDGIDEAWAVSGPPALIVLLSRLGAFGEGFDLVVSGINPGCNVGRAVYHSGTIGATLTGRNGGISGVAVSQSADFSVQGQGYVANLDGQHWQTAATVASVVVQGLIDDLPSEPAVVNVNVPNVPIADLSGWRRCEVGTPLASGASTVSLEPRPGEDDVFDVKMSWGSTSEDLPAGSDSRAVEDGFAAISWLSRITDQHRTDTAPVYRQLDGLLGTA